MESNNNFFELIEWFKKNVDWLNEILIGGETDSTWIDGVEKPSIEKRFADRFSAFQAMVQGRVAFETLAELQSSGAPPSDKPLAEVWADPVEPNNGVYGYRNNQWELSPLGEIRDSTVGRAKLKQTFLTNPQLAVASDLNAIVTDGYHYGQSYGDFVHLPDGFDSSKAFVLFVAEAFDAKGRFHHQRICYFQSPHVSWVRFTDQNGVYGQWVSEYEVGTDRLKPKSVTNEKLGDKSVSRENLQNGFLLNAKLPAGADLNLITDDGYHYGETSGGYKNLPVDFALNQNFLLLVMDSYDGQGRFHHQRVCYFKDPKYSWVRFTDQNGVFGDWASEYFVPKERLAPKSVTGDKLDDSVVSRQKLSKTPLFCGQLALGIDLNTIDRDGLYSSQSNGNYVNLPDDFDQTRLFTLEVKEAFDGATRFKHQILRDFREPHKTWLRWLDVNTGIGEWFQTYQNELMLTREVLPDGASTHDAIKDGIYHLAAGRVYVDMPADAPDKDFTMEVCEAYAVLPGRFKRQTLRVFNDSSNVWIRCLDLDNANNQAWSRPSVSPLSVGHSQLMDHPFDAGRLDSGDANAIARDGAYLITGNFSNLPPGTTSGILEVCHVYNGDWGFQDFTDLKNARKKWRRIIRPNTGAHTEWQGLNFASQRLICFGDSITEFGDYPDHIAAMLGCEVIEAGFGGCRLADHSNAIWATMSMHNIASCIATGNYTSLIKGAQDLLEMNGDNNIPQAERVRDADWPNIDVVTIFYGTNDFSGDVPLGEPSDITGATFYGAINKTISSLLGAYPHLKLLFVTPIWRSRIAPGDGLDSDNNPNGIGLYLIDYVNALKERCQHWKVPCKDMYNSTPINALTGDFYLSDGVHPTAKGYELIGRKIAAAVSQEY
ncbi:TPA: hypothetical protein NG644_001415 [Vibrio parahaemolyticus]|nr:hypothetical protein [Vibrio parahaemolyticus]